MSPKNRADRNEAPWTDADHTATRNLASLWSQIAPKKKLTQTGFARFWNMSQPAVHLYLHGVNKLNPEAILKFAKYLGVEPVQIDPRIARLMKIKDTHAYAIFIDTDEFEPRIQKGDSVTIDIETPPTVGDLTIAYNALSVQIGYLTPEKTLRHPATSSTITPDPSMLIQKINSIKPGVPHERITRNPNSGVLLCATDAEG